MLNKDSKIKIEMNKEMSESLYATLTAYYLPLMKESAFLFYISLLAIEKAQFQIKNHLLLQRICGLSYNLMEKARKSCEEFLLLRTFYKKEEDLYLYVLDIPMHASKFLSHEVFGRLFIHKMGEDGFAFYKSHLQSQTIIKKEYDEISSTMQDTLKNHWDMKQEEVFQAMKETNVQNSYKFMHIIFDEKLFLSNLSELMFPKKERTTKNLRMISELATIYGINEKMMRSLIGRGVNPATHKFESERLKKACLNTKAKYVMENKDPFKLPPRRFLEQKQNGATLSKSDIILIEKLLCDYTLQPEVVNVLLETCILKDKNHAIVASRVERMAGGWLRLNIDTFEKAKQQQKIEMETKIGINKQSIVQEWEAEEESTMSNEERQALIDRIRRNGES